MWCSSAKIYLAENKSTALIFCNNPKSNEKSRRHFDEGTRAMLKETQYFFPASLYMKKMNEVCQQFKRKSHEIKRCSGVM